MQRVGTVSESDHQRAELADRLAIYLDPSSDVPVYRQIVDRVWLEVVTGTVETGERLPTVRQMAIDLGLPPKVITRAYEELELLGIVTMKPGRGAFVSLTQPDRSEVERRSQLERLCRDVVSQAEALGFTLGDVMEALGDLRSARRDADTRRGGP